MFRLGEAITQHRMLVDGNRYVFRLFDITEYAINCNITYYFQHFHFMKMRQSSVRRYPIDEIDCNTQQGVTVQPKPELDGRGNPKKKLGDGCEALTCVLLRSRTSV